MRDDHALTACPPREIGVAETLRLLGSDISRGESASTPLQLRTIPPHRILVVDDEKCVRHLNTAMLVGAGYEVAAAEDGAAAWEALGAGRYDLLITDNNMPKVSGIELLKKVRAAGMALPVIMATGTLPMEEFARYAWLQPAALLLKPYSIAEMLGTVEKVLYEANCPTDPVS